MSDRNTARVMSGQNIAAALRALQDGRFVLVYDGDGREEETDLVIASQFVTSSAVRTMRTQGGGLICTTVAEEVRRKLGVPYLYELQAQMSRKYPVLQALSPYDIPYDTKSSFAITINHRNTFTGVTDIDRALTISEFARFSAFALSASNGIAVREFGRQFRSPGHVPLLNCASGLLEERRGHTELATCLVMMADLVPTATICEMMGEDGRALPKQKAKKFAKEKKLIFIEGSDIIEAWKRAYLVEV